MQIPFVGFQPVQSSEHMAVGVGGGGDLDKVAIDCVTALTKPANVTMAM